MRRRVVACQQVLFVTFAAQIISTRQVQNVNRTQCVGGRPAAVNHNSTTRSLMQSLVTVTVLSTCMVMTAHLTPSLLLLLLLIGVRRISQGRGGR